MWWAAHARVSIVRTPLQISWERAVPTSRMDKRTRRSPKPDDVPRPWTGARIGQTGGNSPSIRHVMPEVIMRLLTAATLLAGVTAGAYAHAPASVQEPIANDSASTATQAPFRMPAFEQRNIAENPSWTAPQKPFRIYGNTWHVGRLEWQHHHCCPVATAVATCWRSPVA